MMTDAAENRATDVPADNPSDSAASPAISTPSVSVLIVGYNTKELVINCLTSLFEHTHGLDFEVLFVDCSNDGSVETIREQFPDVRVIDNEQNLGFGRGNNFLARHARGDYLLLINPDTLIKDNAILGLYEVAQRHPEGGAWGGVTRLPGGEIDPGCQQAGVGLSKSLLLLLGLSKLACPDVVSTASEVIDVPSLSGAFMMLPRDLWESLGGFDESFFMYSEETELCYRVRQGGRRVLITPNSSIVHLVGSGSAQSPKRMLALTRGGMHLTRKHYGPIYICADASIRWLHSASRYTLGLLGAPFIGFKRAAQLRARHAPIIFHPSQWVRGWATSTSNQSQPEPNSS